MPTCIFVGHQEFGDRSGVAEYEKTFQVLEGFWFVVSGTPSIQYIYPPGENYDNGAHTLKVVVFACYLDPALRHE